MNNIGFYFEANSKIGGGHFWRCYNFAKNIKKKNKKFFFISSKLNAKYLKFLDKENFIYIQNNDLKNIIKLKSIIYKNKIHILVNDYYELSYENKKKISGYVKKFIIVDDHINRKHCCDILINAHFLEKNMISTTVYYTPAHKHDFYKRKFNSKNLANTNNLFNNSLSLPFHNNLTSKEIKKVTKLVRKFFNEN